MFWNKKKKTDDLSEEKPKFDDKLKLKTEKNDYKYRVYIKDINGSSTKKREPFGVNRVKDKDTNTIFLVNEDKEFKEREPKDDNSYKIYSIDEVIKKIKTSEKKLAKEMKFDGKENIKDIKTDLFIYNNYKRSLELQGRGSYLNYDNDNVPYFVFRTKGSFYLPEFDNVDLDTIYTPSETRIKKASELITQKEEKYSKFNKKMSTVLIMYFLLLLVFTGILIYWSFQLNTMSNESTAVQLQNRIDETALFCASQYAQAGENFKKASENSVNMTQNMLNVIDKINNAPKLKGIVPK